MHDIRWIRDNPNAFVIGLNRRGLDGSAILNEIEKLDGERKANIPLVQKWREERNRKSRQIGIARLSGDEQLVSELMQEVSRLKSDIAKAATQVTDEVSGKLKHKLAEIPNLPLEETPDGEDEYSNVELHRYFPEREIKFEGFAPKQHFELGEALDQMDFVSAAKLSGSRFVVLKKGLARLERALGQFMLDLHTTEHGYAEVAPPLLVRDAVMFGTAQLPKFKDDQFPVLTKFDLAEIMKEYKRFVASTSGKARNEIPITITQLDPKVARDGILRSEILHVDEGWFREFEARWSDADYMKRLWLIPTAEVPLTNLVRESTLDEARLPLRIAACTPCFRAEAGAAGKDTRGMIRQHQFTKVELVSITTPEQSKQEHEHMLACAEEVLRRLDLHYRVVALCAGDMGFASQKTYDIEVWLPGQNKYREISSCSTCGEFQARRMNARYRLSEGGESRYVHTLNGSGVAVGRALIAVMETYQQEDGSIAVPGVLAPYMGGIKKIEKL